nr:PH domain-containing protein [Cryptococcus depauperatus CBS 7841]
MSSPQSTPIIPAPPPSKLEIERKLSFRSAAPPRDSPKKSRKLSHTQHSHSALSGNDSDSSSIASSVPAGLSSPNLTTHPTSPLLTPATTSVGGLSAIAERKFGGDEEIDTMIELEDVEEEGEEANGESASEAEEGQDELQRDMEGERVVMSGYLWKKQERRKAWKKRWFVLRTNKLAYYKDEKEYYLKRVINLQEIHTVAPVAVKKHLHSFGIVVPKRTFFVKAPSAAEMEEWVHAINEMRRRISEKEEEERSKKEKGDTHHHGQLASSQAKSVSIPQRTIPTPHNIDTISPSNNVDFGNTIFSSPQSISSAGGQSGIIIPSSPIDNNLTTQFMKISMGGLSTPRLSSGTRVASGSTRRDPSAGSLSPGLLAPVSSEDEDEAEGLEETPVAPADSNKVILQAYLMKQSRRRKDVWRKRWFVLTSQGLAYSRSHMESKAQQFIPLGSILDVLEVLSDDTELDGDDMDYLSAHGHTHSAHHLHHAQSPPRQFIRGRLPSITASETPKRPPPPPKEEEHTFKLITAKRNFLISAPSEEDEIKWLAAFRALLERQRIERAAASGYMAGSPSLVSMAPHVSQSSQLSQPQKRLSVPVITQQPPTPSSGITLVSPTAMLTPVKAVVSTPTASTTSGPSPASGHSTQPLQNTPAPMSLANRGRSATYTAKSAVADVVRKLHSEREKEV